MRATLALLAVAGCGTPTPAPRDAGADTAPVAAPDDAVATDAGDDLPADAVPATAAPLGPVGATVRDGGVDFRVWAPHADRVFVAGDFNAWSPTAHPLASEGGGYWAGAVAGVRAGAAYEFVIDHAGQVLHRMDPRARLVTGTRGHCLVVDPGAYAWRSAGFQPAAPEATVAYELHVGTFNAAAGGPVGTFASAHARLDHLAALGVNLVELMPPAQFPGDHSWGYNPAFPFAVDTTYGAPDELRAFIDDAHARGIGVLIDVVHNHWGPRDLPMWCFDGECAAAGVAAAGAYFYPDARQTTPWGPRPDFGTRAVRDYIVDSARMWLAEYRADGLRWDSTVSIRRAGNTDLPEGFQLLQQMNVALARDFPTALQVAEDLQTFDGITRSVSAGGAGFGAQWDAAFFHPVDDALTAATDAARDMNAVRDAVRHAYNGRAFQRVVYTEDHDEVANGRARIPEMVSPGDAGSFAGRKRSTLGAAVVLTSPGIPMLFMGQEFLQDGSFADTRPLDWTRATTYAGILQLYQDLVALRRNRDGSTRGLLGPNVNVFHVNDAAKVIAWHRWDHGGAGDDVVVVANFSGRVFTAYDVGLPHGGAWRVRLDTDWPRYSADFGPGNPASLGAIDTARDGFDHHGAVRLGAWSVVILSQ